MYPANRRIHTISDKLGVKPPKQKKYKKPARYIGVDTRKQKTVNSLTAAARRRMNPSNGIGVGP